MFEFLDWIGSQWWFWVVGVLAFVGLIVLFFILRSRQSRED